MGVGGTIDVTLDIAIALHLCMVSGADNEMVYFFDVDIKTAALEWLTSGERGRER